MRVTDRENAYFTSISTISEDLSALPKLMTRLIKISEQEVIDMLETLNKFKASGPDGISNKMMKGHSKTFIADTMN